MTNDELICTALAPLNMPVAELIYTDTKSDFVVYNLVSQRETAADNGNGETITEYYINAFTRGGNPNPLRVQMRRLMKAAGFYIKTSQVLYDDTAQARFHIVFDIEILNNE